MTIVNNGNFPVTVIDEKGNWATLQPGGAVEVYTSVLKIESVEIKK